MKWIMWILIFLLVLFMVILITKIKVKIRYQHIRENDEFIIKLSAWFGLLHYTIHVPVINVDLDSASIKLKENTGKSDQSKIEKDKRITPESIIDFMKNMQILLEQVVGLHKIIRHFLKKVQVKQFEWHSRIGLGDAAHTGALVGASWAIKGSIIGLLTSTLHFRVHPLLTITPDFQENSADTTIICILRFRIGQAIMTGIKLLRYWKGSKAKLITGSLVKQSDNSNNQSM